MSLVDAIKRYLCNVVSATSVRWASLKLDGLFAQGINTAAVSAAGTTAADATALPAVQYVRLTGGTNGQGVSLPSISVSGSVLTGVSYTITNNSNTAGAIIQVYPSATAGVGTINNKAAGAAYQLAPGDTQTFITTATNTWFTTSSFVAAGGAGLISEGTANFSVTPLQAGGIFFLPNAAGVNTITLPLASTFPQGAKLTFVQSVVSGGAGHSWAITPTTDTCMGAISLGASILQKSNAASVTFTTTAAAGDWLEFVVMNQAGGANSWFVKGTSSAAAGIS